jgi:peptidoglycan/LPS O-acetylase OafA/YrhL
MVWGAFILGIVLVQRVGRDEAVHSLYKQNFKKTKVSPNKMWGQFTTLCYFGSLVYILHHFSQDNLWATVRYIYYPLGLFQCILVMGLVFAESPIKYKYENTAQIKPNKASSVSVLTRIMWLAGFLMFILFLVFMNAEVDSHGEDEAANIFCISFVLFFIVGIAKLLEILKGHDAKHSIVDIPDWSTLKKETKAESDPIPSVVATPIFNLEEHTNKSIKEIEEEQKALVSEILRKMEDKS